MKKNTPNKVDHRFVEHVIATVKKAENKEDALQKCIDKVCTQLEWPIGHVYFPWCSELYELDSSKIWYFDNSDRYKVFREITETTRPISLDIDVDLPGRVLKTRKPAWIPDVTKDTNFPRAKGAQDIGVKAAFAFPVIADSEVIAVLEFFHTSDENPDEQILESVENIGKQVGRVIKIIERKQGTAQFRELDQGIKGRDSREFKPENLICLKYLDTYTREIETLWQQVLRLNAYIYCIKHIKESPFDLFKHNPSPFWTCVEESMFESLTMVINRILIDKDNKGRNLTLEGFKDKIVCNLTDEEYKEKLEKNWDVQWKKIDPNIVKRFKELRNKDVAHLDRDSNIYLFNESNERTFYLTEIREFKININTLFQMLNLGHIFPKTDLDYDSNGKHPSDIETLLDTIAEKSAIMNMPEKDSEKWLQYRKKLGDSQIKIFNKYRKKFKLPPA